MNVLVWIIFGAVAGWIASLVMKNDANQGTLMDIVMGIVGAVVGGYLAGFLGFSGVTGFNLYSLLVAVIGASVVIFVGRALRRSSV